MPTIRTATAIAVTARPGAPLAIKPGSIAHVAAAAWVIGLLVFAAQAPLQYAAAVQEDRFIEWLTVALFAAAGLVRIRYAIQQRRVLDALIALFCVFVAGEEFSWGQRLLGFTPPDVFLAHNTQQEVTLHNFADLFGQPKGVLMLALLGFALLGLVGLNQRLRRLLERVGATAPPLGAVPWLIASVGLLYWYPVEYTGEWVEALAGGIFLFSFPLKLRTAVLTLGVSIVTAVTLTMFSARGLAAHPATAACARRELDALADDLSLGNAATPDLTDRSGSVHKRVYTAQQDGYIRSDKLTRYRAVACGNASSFAIDPWGMAYWIRFTISDQGNPTITVYSMGPNRRRDHQPNGGDAGDDILVSRAAR